MLEHFGWGAVQASELLQELDVRQIVSGRIGVWELWRGAAGDEELDGQAKAIPAERAGQIEGDHCAHAVAEEGEGVIEVWSERFSRRVDRFQKTAVGGLGDAASTPRKLDR